MSCLALTIRGESSACHFCKIRGKKLKVWKKSSYKSDNELKILLTDFSSGSGYENGLDGEDGSSSDEAVSPPSRHERRRRSQPHYQCVNQPVPDPVQPPQSPTEPLPPTSSPGPQPSTSPPGPSPPHVNPQWVRVYPPEKPRDIKRKFRVKDPGPRHTEGCSKPIDFFTLFMSNKVWNLMVQETNKFAQKHINSLIATERYDPNSRMHRWVEVTVEEIKKFWALMINMGLTRRKEIQHFWSTQPNLYIPLFSQTMSLRRFQQILAMLHVSNRISSPKGQPGYDPWVEVREFFDHMNLSFKRFFVPKQEVCIDESKIVMKNRCISIEYVANKCHSRFGLMKFDLCDASTGYILQSSLHSGSDFLQNGGSLFTHKVVHDLMSKAGLYGKGYHLFTNNFYTKIDLANFLRVRKTYLTGTIGRRLISQLMEQTADDDESFYIRNGKVLILNYQESAICKPVVLISTASHAGDQQVVSHGRVKGIKPTAVASYNQHMGDVERHKDKSIYHVTRSHKPKSYWKNVVYSLVDMALLNSYILYSHQSNRPMQWWEYLSDVVNSLLPIPDDAPGSQGGNRLSNPVKHLPSSNHKLQSLPGNNLRKCVVCKLKCGFVCLPCNAAAHKKCFAQMQHFVRGDSRGGHRRRRPQTSDDFGDKR